MSSARPGAQGSRYAVRCWQMAFQWCRWCETRRSGRQPGSQARSGRRICVRPRHCETPWRAPCGSSLAPTPGTPCRSSPRRRVSGAGAAGQHPEIHPLAGCARQRRAGGGGGAAGFGANRRDAAPDDDLRRAGRGQRAAAGRDCCGGCRCCRFRAAAGFWCSRSIRSTSRAASGRRWRIGGSGPRHLVIAGPEPVRYADFVRAVAAAAGLRRPRILPFPAAPLIAGRAPDDGMLPPFRRSSRRKSAACSRTRRSISLRMRRFAGCRADSDWRKGLRGPSRRRTNSDSLS